MLFKTLGHRNLKVAIFIPSFVDDSTLSELEIINEVPEGYMKCLLVCNPFWRVAAAMSFVGSRDIDKVKTVYCPIMKLIEQSGLVIDRILRLERLDKDAAFLGTEFKVPKKPNFDFTSVEQHLIRDLLKRDFTLFGYDLRNTSW